MNKETIRVLIVEDDPDLNFLMKELLKTRKAYNYEPKSVTSLAETREVLSKDRFDVVLLDLDLPDSKGVDTVVGVCKDNPYIPVIAITGQYSESLAVNVLAGGAQDYLVKSRYDNDTLDRAIYYSIERKKAEKRLKESEEKFRIIFENSAVAITVTDENERIISWNKFAEGLLGMGRDELYLKPVSFLYPEKEWKKIRSLHIRQAGMRYHLETVVIKRDRTELDVDISISVLKDSGGDVTGSIGIIRDISERKEVEKILKGKVRRSDIIFKLIQDLAPDMLSAEMLKLIIRAARSLVGADTASVILLDESQGQPRVIASESAGVKVDDSILQPSLDENTSITGWVIKNKEPLLLHGIMKNDERFRNIKWKGGIKCSINVPIVFKDSVKGTLNMNMTTSDYIFVEDDMESVVALANHVAIALENSGLYKGMKDKLIEGLKDSNEELERSNNELKQARSQLIQSEKMSAIGQLASGVAHEINNPLSGVLGNIQIIMMELKSGSKIEDIGELLGVIEKSAKRCKSITQNLLDFSRTKKDIFEAFDIYSVLDSVIMLIGHSLKNSNIEVKRRYAEGFPRALGNANQIQQVFLNMLSNAKWAIEKKGEKSGSITIEMRKIDTKFLEVSFSDTGIGMSKEAMTKIFDPFYTTKEVGKGTGLGLSICYGIMQKHDGGLSVKSEEGKGTTFSIKLPIAKEKS